MTAAATRRERRLERIDEGMVELERWLLAIVRAGLGSGAATRSEEWEAIAARMVDAQAPAVARELRELARLDTTEAAEEILRRMARLWLLTGAWRRRLQLRPLALQDLLAAVGVPPPLKEVREQRGIEDRWSLLGIAREREGGLRSERLWFQGERSRLLTSVQQHAHGDAPFELAIDPGRSYRFRLAGVPGLLPLRAVVITPPTSPLAVTTLPGYPSLTSALGDYGEALQRNPWIERFPLALRGVLPRHVAGEFEIVDGDGAVARIAPSTGAWPLIAVAGGSPIDLFGEWDGARLHLLGAIADRRYLPF